MRVTKDIEEFRRRFAKLEGKRVYYNPDTRRKRRPGEKEWIEVNHVEEWEQLYTEEKGETELEKAQCIIRRSLPPYWWIRKSTNEIISVAQEEAWGIRMQSLPTGRKYFGASEGALANALIVWALWGVYISKAAYGIIVEHGIEGISNTKGSALVHHINEDEADDRPENLQCIAFSEHQALHHVKGDTSDIKPDWKREIEYTRRARNNNDLNTWFPDKTFRDKENENTWIVNIDLEKLSEARKKNPAAWENFERMISTQLSIHNDLTLIAKELGLNTEESETFKAGLRKRGII